MQPALASRLTGLLMMALLTGGCFLPRARQVPHRTISCSATTQEPQTAADVLRDESRDRVDYCQFAESLPATAATAVVPASTD